MTAHGFLPVIFGLLLILLPTPSASGSEAGTDQSDTQDVVYLMDSKPVLMRLHVRIDGKPFRAVWNAFLDELFKKLDVNKDGVLEKEEAARIPAPGEVFASGGFFGGGRGLAGAKVDTDGDGKVTRTELGAYYKKNGGAPFQLRQGRGSPGRVQFVGIDGYSGRSASADELNKALFRLLDANKDGKLSKDEMLAAEKRLLKMDADDDETVNAAELRGESTRTAGAEIGEFLLVADGNFNGNQPNNLPFVVLGPKEVSATLANRLLDHYASKAAKQKATQLTREQLGLGEVAFKQLDTNKDGKLDAEELARFTHRAADVELNVNLTKDGKLTVEAVKDSTAPLAKLLTANKDGTAKLVLGTSQLDLRPERPDGGNITFASVGGLDDMVLKMQFSAADTDNNGYLDMTEARRNGFFAGSFKAMDADGDGKLYLKETLAYVERQKDLRSKAAVSRVSLAIRDEGKGLFDLFDRNGDGRLSVREMRDTVLQIAALDTNKDGAIDLSEIPRRYALSPLLGPSNAGGFGGAAFAVSIDGGGFSRQPAAPQAGPLWFRKMDRNRDGDVSRREFLGTREQFDRINTDGDGLMSLAEAEKIEESMKKRK